MTRPLVPAKRMREDGSRRRKIRFLLSLPRAGRYADGHVAWGAFQDILGQLAYSSEIGHLIQDDTGQLIGA